MNILFINVILEYADSFRRRISIPLALRSKSHPPPPSAARWRVLFIGRRGTICEMIITPTGGRWFLLLIAADH